METFTENVNKTFFWSICQIYTVSSAPFCFTNKIIGAKNNEYISLFVCYTPKQQHADDLISARLKLRKLNFEDQSNVISFIGIQFLFLPCALMIKWFFGAPVPTCLDVYVDHHENKKAMQNLSYLDTKKVRKIFISNLEF